MKKKTTIMVSFIMAFFLISGGYGYWQKELRIEGSITVKAQPPRGGLNTGNAPVHDEGVSPINVNLEDVEKIENIISASGSEDTTTIPEEPGTDLEILNSPRVQEHVIDTPDVVQENAPSPMGNGSSPNEDITDGTNSSKSSSDSIGTQESPNDSPPV